MLTRSISRYVVDAGSTNLKGSDSLRALLLSRDPPRNAGGSDTHRGRLVDPDDAIHPLSRPETKCLVDGEITLKPQNNKTTL